MAFYPILFGHVEVRIDRRDPRPPHLVEDFLRRPAGFRRWLRRRR